MRIVLASTSPRRLELLERIGIDIDVCPADVDESTAPGEDAVVYARRLAGEKAATIAALRTDSWILAADTVVEIDGRVLGKAQDETHAREMIVGLLGRTHRVTTAFCLRGPGYARQREVTTLVTMREALPGEIDSYIASGEWRGKAGAYAVQGMAGAMVSKVDGSITNVIGLPLSEVVEALAEARIAVPVYTQGTPA